MASPSYGIDVVALAVAVVLAAAIVFLAYQVVPRSYGPDDDAAALERTHELSRLVLPASAR